MSSSSSHSGAPDTDPDLAAASPVQAISGGQIVERGCYPAAASSAAMPQDTAAFEYPFMIAGRYRGGGVAAEETVYHLWQALYPVPGAYDQEAAH